MNTQHTHGSVPALDRSALRALARQAQRIKPVVMVGKNGISDSVVRACVDALASHELVKVRFQDFKEERQSLAAELSHATGSNLVRIIGHVAILYREHPDAERRRYAHLVADAL